MKLSPHFRETLQRIVAMAVIAEKSETAAEALADALDELGETPQGERLLRRLCPNQ